jgi:L-lactate dehydrogenase (cytochrome)
MNTTTAAPAAGHSAVRSDQRAPTAALALSDFETMARRRLPRPIYGFVRGGAETEAALRDNAGAYAEHALVPRVLQVTTHRHQRRGLLGTQHAAPFGIAPMGGALLAAYDADRVLASVARERNIPFVLSGASLTPMEALAQPGEGGWFQAYIPGDAARIQSLLDRVERAGFDRLVVTVDLAVPGNRENNVRNGFSLPLQPGLRLAFDGLRRPRWLAGTALRTLVQRGMPHFENMDAQRGPPIVSGHLVRDVGNRDGLAWRHVELIRQRWKGKLVLKGVLAAGDAQLAQQAGVDAIVVSNHGGRQLDGAVAPLRVLPEIRAAAPGLTLIVDGGIRRGTDVLKALALGADFVWLGRPFLFAAAAAGAPGVRHAIDILQAEVDRNMALLGLTDLAQIGPEHVRKK